MSTYVREKVLRIPREQMNFAHVVKKLEEKYPDEDIMDDLGFYPLIQRRPIALAIG